MSGVSQRIQDANDEAEEASPASEPSRPTEPWRRPPPAREAFATLDEEDFDYHDTIPAPPWLDEAPESTEDPFQSAALIRPTP